MTSDLLSAGGSESGGRARGPSQNNYCSINSYLGLTNNSSSSSSSRSIDANSAEELHQAKSGSLRPQNEADPEGSRQVASGCLNCGRDQTGSDVINSPVDAGGGGRNGLVKSVHFVDEIFKPLVFVLHADYECYDDLWCNEDVGVSDITSSVTSGSCRSVVSSSSSYQLSGCCEDGEVDDSDITDSPDHSHDSDPDQEESLEDCTDFTSEISHSRVTPECSLLGISHSQTVTMDTRHMLSDEEYKAEIIMQINQNLELIKDSVKNMEVVMDTNHNTCSKYDEALVGMGTSGLSAPSLQISPMSSVQETIVEESDSEPEPEPEVVDLLDVTDTSQRKSLAVSSAASSRPTSSMGSPQVSPRARHDVSGRQTPVMAKSPAVRRRRVGTCLDIDEVKELTSRLNLVTRRPSVHAWQQQHFVGNRPALWSSTSCEDSTEDEDDSPEWSSHFKNKINGQLDWLRKELIGMREQDATLARQLLNIRKDMYQLKLQRSTQHHRMVLDDALEQEVERDELQQVRDCDLLPDQASPTLREYGLTRTSRHSRRFSVF